MVYSPKRIDIEQLVGLISGKKVALFTGAGISMKAGIVDLKALTNLQNSLFYPLEQFYDDIKKGNIAARIEIYKKLDSMFIESEPTQTHWIIKDLCDLYGFTLITGNFDGLHEKTGIQPIFQNTDEVLIPELDSYDILLTVGLSVGIGKVAEEYHTGNPNGSIVAINNVAPGYLNNKDYFIEGESDIVFSALKQRLQKDNNK